ncbi:MAG: hypothetical protein A2176_12050 [Spirochaetes bacterium RBG_13_51_14]|nr:MAG: hypothetical protein A2176_12050 [Spirochaetes bacterium RBG_13_51_14]
MDITISNQTDDMAIVSISGKFTIEDVHPFKDKTGPLIKDTMKTILMNLGEMEYIDSSGIGALILLTNSSKNLNIDLIIYNIQKEIMNVFKIAYLDKFFHIVPAAELKKAFPDIHL